MEKRKEPELAAVKARIKSGWFHTGVFLSIGIQSHWLVVESRADGMWVGWCCNRNTLDQLDRSLIPTLIASGWWKRGKMGKICEKCAEHAAVPEALSRLLRS